MSGSDSRPSLLLRPFWTHDCLVLMESWSSNWSCVRLWCFFRRRDAFRVITAQSWTSSAAGERSSNRFIFSLVPNVRISGLWSKLQSFYSLENSNILNLTCPKSGSGAEAVIRFILSYFCCHKAEDWKLCRCRHSCCCCFCCRSNHCCFCRCCHSCCDSSWSLNIFCFLLLLWSSEIICVNERRHSVQKTPASVHVLQSDFIDACWVLVGSVGFCWEGSVLQLWVWSSGSVFQLQLWSFPPQSSFPSQITWLSKLTPLVSLTRTFSTSRTEPPASWPSDISPTPQSELCLLTPQRLHGNGPFHTEPQEPQSASARQETDTFKNSPWVSEGGRLRSSVLRFWYTTRTLQNFRFLQMFTCFLLVWIWRHSLRTWLSFKGFLKFKFKWTFM